MDFFNRDKNTNENQYRCHSSRKKKLDMSKIRYEMLLLRVKALKHKLFIQKKKEKKIEQEKRNKDEQWESSYWKINEISNKFFRNDNRLDNPFNFNIERQKLKVNLSSKANRINSTFRKISSHYDISKAKIENKVESGFDEGVNEIKKRLFNIKKKIKVINLSSTKNTISMDSYSEKIKTPKVNHNFYNQIFSERKKNHKLTKKILSKGKINLKQKSTPKKLNRNFSSRSSLKTNKRISIINKPIFFHKVSDILSDYYKIRISIKNDKEKLKSSPFIIDDANIDSIMDNIEEMRLFKLKEKFINLRLKKNKKKFFSLSDFTDRLKTLCEEIDDPYIRY
jgi:hypothetical protein